MATDYEDSGGGVQLAFGENAAGTRYPLRTDNDGQLLIGSIGASGTMDVNVVNSVVLQSGTADVGNVVVSSGALHLTSGTADVGNVIVSSGAVRLTSGTADVGYVGSYGKTINLSPTVTAGAYVANDNVGERLELANAARVSGGGGVITDVVWVDADGQDAELELWLFDQSFTAGTDNAHWTCGTVDLANVVGVISTLDSDQGWLAAGTPSVCTASGLTLRYDCAATSLFGRNVTRGTPTFTTTSSLVVKIGVLMD